jgi:hypothetical protein
MTKHRFAIGQTIHLRSKFGLSPKIADRYRITGLLPEINNSPQYRIRSDDERHDRVATEDDLQEAESSAAYAETKTR